MGLKIKLRRWNGYGYWNLYDENFTANIDAFHAATAPFLYDENFSLHQNFYHKWLQNNPNGNYLDFLNQLDWRIGQELGAEYQSTFADVFFYLFSEESPNELLGSCHAVDLPFVFGNSDNQLYPNPPANLDELRHAYEKNILG